MGNIQSLFLSDNDGTLFDTFKGPSGFGVNEAYEAALHDIFGWEASNMFKVFGLQNRAPREVIEQIFPSGELLNGKRTLMKNARTFFRKYVEDYNSNLVPEGKGIKLVWDEEFGLKDVFTELLVRVKLSYLIKNIGVKLPDGSFWPKMFSGAKDFVLCIKKSVDFGIISSGHDNFIKKSFEVNQMECPEIMITDDDLRGLRNPISKPDPGLIELALKKWNPKSSFSVVYTGDDMEKDGGLAKNAGIPFIFFDQNNNEHWTNLRSKFEKGGFSSLLE